LCSPSLGSVAPLSLAPALATTTSHSSLTTFSQTLLLVAGALVSCAIAIVHDESDDGRRSFFRYQNTSTWLAAVATSWTKVAFAITLTKIIAQWSLIKYFLWFLIAVANLILIPGTLSIWIPACGDPRAIYRPAHPMCWELPVLQYLGGSFMGKAPHPHPRPRNARQDRVTNRLTAPSQQEPAASSTSS